MTTEPQVIQAQRMSEAQLQAAVIELAERLGYLVYHTYDSRRSQAGFPDLVLAHSAGRLIFAELKTERGRMSAPQRRWLDALAQSRLARAIVGWSEAYQVHVWTPQHWLSGEIERVLTFACAAEEG